MQLSSVNLLESGESGSIHYDDKAIVNLLDRNREGLEEKALLANEYLASFKVWRITSVKARCDKSGKSIILIWSSQVASYIVRQNEEEEDQDKVEVIKVNWPLFFLVPSL